MSRRLTTYVHVDGVAWGPGDDIPADVAARITNPDVWDGPEEVAAEPTAQPAAAAPKPVPKRRTAAKKD